MRDAAVPGYRLAKSRRSFKFLVTLGMLGLFLGLASSLILTVLKTGITPSSVERYYRGTSSAATGNVDELLVPTQPRPLLELAEVTHLHLMGGSLLLFLLCHLLSVCEVSESFRTAVYILAFMSFLGTFGSPWLVIFVSPRCSYLYGPSIVVLMLSLVLLCLVPLWEMWVRR